MAAIDFELLVRILVAHVLSDFILQPTLWVEAKESHGLKSKYFYLHILVTAIVLMIMIWDIRLFPVVIYITGAHLIIDAVKSILTNSNIWIFLVDQFLHLIVILIVWLGYTHQFQIFFTTINTTALHPKLWWLIFFYLLLTIPTSVLIGKMTQKWSDEIDKETENKKIGLKDAGKWIGIIERLLIFTFIVVDKMAVIGFLLAAKSVFRFGDLKESSEHKKTEYIIIGTFLSFVLAVGVGLLYQYIVK